MYKRQEEVFRFGFGFGGWFAKVYNRPEGCGKTSLSIMVRERFRLCHTSAFAEESSLNRTVECAVTWRDGSDSLGGLWFRV